MSYLVDYHGGVSRVLGKDSLRSTFIKEFISYLLFDMPKTVLSAHQSIRLRFGRNDPGDRFARGEEIILVPFFDLPRRTG